jgi:hypothetical protein
MSDAVRLPLLVVVALLTVVAMLAALEPIIAVWVVLGGAGIAGVWTGWFATHG